MPVPGILLLSTLLSLVAQGAPSKPARTESAAAAKPGLEDAAGAATSDTGTAEASPVDSPPPAGRGAPGYDSSATAGIPLRRPYAGLHGGVTFFNLDGKDRLSRGLTPDNSQTLQPFEPVHLAFPLGLLAALPVGRYLDMAAKVQGFRYRQTMVAERTEQGARVVEQSAYAVQGLSGALGFKYYIPPAFLSVTGHNGLYLAYWHHWILGPNELYTDFARARAPFDGAGSGFALEVGFQHRPRRSWFWVGSLSYQSLDFQSGEQWSDLLAPGAGTPADREGEVAWSLKGLQFGLHAFYRFGREKDAATVRSARAVQ